MAPRLRAPYPRRAVLLRDQRGGLDPGPVPGAGQPGLSDALHRLRGQCHAAWVLFGEAVSLTRVGGIGVIILGRLHRFPELTWNRFYPLPDRPSTRRPLPGSSTFSTPGGWPPGPRSQTFEQALADYLGGGRIVRAFSSGTAALEDGARPGGCRPWRRGHRSGHELRRHRQRGGARRCQTGLRRRGARLPQSGLEAWWRRPSPHVPRPSCRCTSPGLPVDIEALYRLAERYRSAGDRGCGPRHRQRRRRGEDRRLRRPGLFQLPSQQEHDHHRRGSAFPGRSGSRRAPGAAALPRHLPHCRGGDGRFGGRREIESLRRRRPASASGQLQRLDEFNAKRRQLADALFRAACRGSAGRPAEAGRRGAQLAHVHPASAL